MIGWGEHCRREVKRGWRRHENEASFGEDKEARPRKENKKKHRAGAANAKWRGKGFIHLGEPCSRNRARRAH
jgi:hypothetical protein